MNRSALKSAGFVLLGVVLGWAVGRAPVWGGGAEAGRGRISGTVVQSGQEAEHGGGPAGPRNETGAGKPSPERLEMLAASFRSKFAGGDGMAATVAITLEAGSSHSKRSIRGPKSSGDSLPASKVMATVAAIPSPP
ncbi:MAG: hypothetical protein EOP86_24390, partial [Verrucomicrobiaceae bacterium]